ncbi:hypothetical protein [Nonomuraea gerenzanensis]|uniref:Uncharacterized protein n=1 Tax=Nonomuraea gerenzanensis TaxID=93944 RepID=A0A1M4EQM6_9ACTN|nr:hypothetical protein [Nonomuraea gerenzanensis]UBU12573.1 hypothetical protein LCN96_51320 [Nonomuraea gerenzanensis]SBP01124.1 hypothetical protein BN4615_P10640 [Nonomuraea gerenzanensis]
MRTSRQDGRRNGPRLSSKAAYLLCLLLNAVLGFLGQFALFYPYFVARDWLARLGFGSPGIPFQDGYLGALSIGLVLVVVFILAMAAVNIVVLRSAPVSRRPYWLCAVLVALASSIFQLLWNVGSLFS